MVQHGTPQSGASYGARHVRRSCAPAVNGALPYAVRRNAAPRRREVRALRSAERGRPCAVQVLPYVAQPSPDAAQPSLDGELPWLDVVPLRQDAAAPVPRRYNLL